MLKNRLIPALFLKHGYLVRSEGFRVHQNLGNPFTQVTRYNAWDVDELIYIDITPDINYEGGRDDLGIRTPTSIQEIIHEVSTKCFMPLTFGGKIRTLEDIRTRLSLGADKITINTAALQDPAFITSAANEFGSQAIVVSVDARCIAPGSYEVFTKLGREPTGRTPEAWAHEAQERGAGEIFLNSIDRDGTAQGYDVELIRRVVDATSVPLIACGGGGTYADFAVALTDGGASAVAAGNIFHFKEMSYILAKKELRKRQLNVR